MRDKLDTKIQLKQLSCTKGGVVDFLLSKSEVQQLLDDARITIDDWRPGGYHLARYGDRGDYVWGNCRFNYRFGEYERTKS